MNIWRALLFENLSKYRYFLSDTAYHRYTMIKWILAGLPLLVTPIFLVDGDYLKLLMIPIGMVLLYKVPYAYLSLVHTQNCNDVIGAIPLWVNQIYALIEKNTIHNAILNSYSEHTPKAIQKDLQEFIRRIELQPDDKDAYLNFLARYRIDGFLDIMLKLYEFRSLSKEKLKYEIKNLNQSLGKIETMKRQNQFRNEVFLGDTCTCFIIFIPCIYMTVISLMPSLFSV